jgi:hypothetical protein
MFISHFIVLNSQCHFNNLRASNDILYGKIIVSMPSSDGYVPCVESTHPDSNPIFNVDFVYLRLIIFLVVDDAPSTMKLFDQLRES